MSLSLDLFPDFFESSVLAVCITDYEGNFVKVNPAYGKLYGISADALIGKPFTIHFPHLSGIEEQLIIKEYQFFINKGVFGKGVFEVKNTEGTRIVVEVFRQLVSVDDKPYVITTLIDITLRSELDAALQESEAQLSAIFESSYHIFCIVDQDYKLIRFNTTGDIFSQLIFKQPLEVGMSALNFVKGSYKRDFILCFQRALSGNITESIHLLKGADHKRWFRFVYEPLPNQDGIIDRVFINATDVSRTMRAEKKSRIKNEKLKQVNKHQKEQMYIISHDLRSPLNSIMGITELISKEEDPQQVKEYLSMIRKLSNQGLIVIDTLTQVGSIENGMLDPDFKNVDISALTHEVLNSHVVDANKKSQELKAQIQDEITAEVDYKMIYSVIDNLLSNAIKYSPKGLPICLNLFSNNDTVTLEVVDAGPGLTDADSKKLFRKFSRLSAKPTANEKSSGLGLYIVKEFINNHDGRIEAKSPGAQQGTTFIVELPLTQLNRSKVKKLVSKD